MKLRFVIPIPFTNKQIALKPSMTFTHITYLSVCVGLVRLGMLGAMLLHQPASALFATLFKDVAHIWIGLCLMGWLYSKYDSAMYYGDESLTDASYWRKSFAYLCYLEIFAAAITIFLKKHG